MREDRWWRRYWRSLGFGREVADELQFHVDLLTKDLVSQGMEPTAAAREATRRFGDRRRVQADLEEIERRRGRRLRIGLWASELWSDIRYGARGLLKRPGFAASAALSLGLGIGAATVVLTVVDNWLLRPMAVERPDELVLMGASSKMIGSFAVPLIPIPAIQEMESRTDLFQSVGAWRIESVGLRIGEDKSTLSYLLSTSGNYFDVIRVRPALGRTYSEADNRERQRVVVLNDRFWRRRFGADPAIIGKSVTLNSLPFTVIGVAPASFTGTEPIIEIDGFIPYATEPDLGSVRAGFESDWGAGNFEVIARRQSSQPFERVRAALEVMTRRMVQAHPELPEGFGILAYPEKLARPTISAAALFPIAATILTALAVMVLGAASVNVANLTLARASTRTAELSVRFALGASRRRVIQQLLTESALLGMLGLGFAYLIAKGAVRLMAAAPVSGTVPIRLDLSVDGRIVAMSALIALGAGLVSGVGPALLASRGQLHDSLRRAGRSGLGGQGRSFRSVLVVGQVAVALVVLVCAGLFVQSARRAAEVDLGFDPRRVMTATIEVEHSHYTAAAAAPILQQVIRRVREMPGIVSADWVTGLPLTGSAGQFRDIYLGTADPKADRRGANSVLSSDVGPDYFATVGMKLLAGRPFTASDDSASRLVAVINQQAAQQLWPGRDPLGQTFRLEPAGPAVDVVGVVNNSRTVLIGESPRPIVFLPWAQTTNGYATLMAKSASRDPMTAARIREIIAAADPRLAPHGFEWFDDIVRDSPNGLGTLRIGAQIGSAIALLALILTVVGLYGVLSFSVTQETREIGVRMALGAEPASIVGRVLARGSRLVGIGIGIGLILALLGTRLLAGLLIGVRPTDLGVFTAVALGLIVVALGAAFLPARRAARLDPVRALRTDA